MPTVSSRAAGAVVDAAADGDGTRAFAAVGAAGDSVLDAWSELTGDAGAPPPHPTARAAAMTALSASVGTREGMLISLSERLVGQAGSTLPAIARLYAGSATQRGGPCPKNRSSTSRAAHSRPS